MNSIEKYPPLKFAKAVSDRANAAWEDGSFIESVTPTTRMLFSPFICNKKTPSIFGKIEARTNFRQGLT